MRTVDKSSIRLAVPSVPDLELRSATLKDIEHLRQWKNAQRQFFFYQEEISVSQQRQWFDEFLLRPCDLMLMVVYRGQAFGCMGIRWQADSEADYWDVYNVILGLAGYGKRGFMGKAFAVLLEFATELRPAVISLQVLKHNPAVGWYEKQGFQITGTHSTHFSMTFHSNRQSELTP